MKAIGYFDGACAPNPGEMGIGAVLLIGGGEVGSVSERRGPGTNNAAEWLALIALLDLARANAVDDLEVRGDSQLVIKQVAGQWKMKAAHLQEYLERALRLKSQFARVNFRWVKRERNQRADYLSTACLR